MESTFAVHQSQGSTSSRRESGTRHAVVCLHDSPDVESWFYDQREAFGAWLWSNGPQLAETPTGVDWAKSAASALEVTQNGPVHVIATGSAALGAIELAASRPDLVLSLVLGDPGDPGYPQLLAAVRTPTLVVAAAPTFDTDLSVPQSVAGGIPNGVFVIIDNCEGPAHRRRPTSFNEWAQSFINIAEGLHAFARPEEDENA